MAGIEEAFEKFVTRVSGREKSRAEQPLSKYKSYSEQELLENIEAKYPNQLQSFSQEDYQLNTMPMFEPKDVAPPKSYSPMPVEKYLREREYMDLANGGVANMFRERSEYSLGGPIKTIRKIGEPTQQESAAGLVFNPGPYEGPYEGPYILGGPRPGQYYQSSPITSITGPDGAIPRPGMPMMLAPRPGIAPRLETTPQIDSIKEAMMSLPQTRSNPRMNAMKRFNQVQDPRMMRLMQMLRRQPAAMGGIMNLKMGGTPVEMDLRAKGGFVPIGKKERADDVPARLSKNEFVFTAKAVRNAGGGDIREGAKRMYNLMNRLEAKK